MFFPEEIIFAATTDCNLKCAHCNVTRNQRRLEIADAIKFLRSAKESEECSIEKIGFSGGEPFLYLDFLTEVIKEGVEQNFTFDRLMTNGLWWNSERQLSENLKAVYDSGFDGKIGLSWDIFHNQDYQKIQTFVKKVLKIFGPESLEIQSAVPYGTISNWVLNRADRLVLKNIKNLAKTLECRIQNYTSFFTRTGTIVLKGKKAFIQVHRTPECFPHTDSRAWKGGKWFKDEDCKSLGNILYVHSDGSIAPCCGFSNESPSLSLGNIRMSYAEVVLNADVNPMVKLCFEKGLLQLAKKLNRQKKLHKKTDDPCAFCGYVSSMKKKNPASI